MIGLDDMGFWKLIVFLFAIIISSETILRLPIIRFSHDLQNLLRRIVWLMTSSHVSDYWKEIVITTYAKRLLGLSFKIPVLLMIGLMPLVLVAFLIAGGWQRAYLLISDPAMLVIMTLVSVFYLYFRIGLYGRLYKS